MNRYASAEQAGYRGATVAVSTLTDTHRVPDEDRTTRPQGTAGHRRGEKPHSLRRTNDMSEKSTAIEEARKIGERAMGTRS